MVRAKTNFAIMLCGLSAVYVTDCVVKTQTLATERNQLAAKRHQCLRSAVPTVTTKRPQPATEYRSRWDTATGEIRASSTADGTAIKCSEVISFSKPALVHSYFIYRSTYEIDMTNNKLVDASNVLDISDMSGGCWFGEGKAIAANAEMIVDTWACKVRAKNKMYVIVSRAVVELADRHLLLYEFPPVFYANGRILEEEVPECELGKPKRDIMHPNGDGKGDITDFRANQKPPRYPDW